MRCPSCDHEMAVEFRRYHYVECGLDNVYLANVEIEVCPRCHEEVVNIPAIAELHRLITGRAITQPGRMLPEQIRFVRKHLGWGADDFARFMNVPEPTIREWESEPGAMDLTHEILLRFHAATRQPKTEYAPSALQPAGPGTQVTTTLSFRHEAAAEVPAWMVETLADQRVAR